MPNNKDDNRQKIFLQRNDLTKNPRLPYFNIVRPPRFEGDDWVRIGALWRTEKGYFGSLEEGVELVGDPKPYNGGGNSNRHD